MTAFLASEGSRRQRKRAQTANHLSATAFRLFETHGYDVVAMEQIAAEADVAKATLYNYFPVKEALIAHRFREDIAAGMAERAAALAAKGLGLAGVPASLGASTATIATAARGAPAGTNIRGHFPIPKPKT